MIFIDLETTGLLKPSACELGFQPFITELYAVRLTDNYDFIAEIETKIKPPVPIPEEVTAITGITNEMVRNAPSFVSMYNKLVDLFLGERIIVGHNISFDCGVLWCELARCGLEVSFPWPPTRVCTVEKSYAIENRRLPLKALYQIATGTIHIGAHRAKNDVIALVRCHMWMKEQGLL
jgi:DNA polymerase III epsilon subunit-like protein